MTGLIVHEWIERAGGAEKVLDAMTGAYPDARIRCLWNDAPERFPLNPPVESWMARTPLRSKKALAVGLMPATWRNLSVLEPVDWILVSSHLFAHHVSLRGSMSDTPKYVYAHTPARYIWEPDLDERGSRFIPQLVSPFLRALDRRRAAEHTNVAANSRFVQQRIRSTWELEATVLYPPVDVKRIQDTNDWANQISHAEAAILNNLPSQFILGASRFVPYKRLDRVIEMGEQAGVPVVIAGNGPDKARLEARAFESNVAVSFVESPSDALLFCLYDRALAYVFPGVEDFGIMPVEAMAAGVPVIVNREGGASESVLDGVTGVHFDFEDMGSADRALASATILSREKCRERAQIFSREIFEENLRQWMGES